MPKLVSSQPSSNCESKLEKKEETKKEKTKKEKTKKNTPSAPPHSWRTSSSKKDLTMALADPSSPVRSMSIKEIHSSSTKYSCYPYTNFHQNVSRLASKMGVVLPKNKKEKKNEGNKKKSSPSWRGSKEKMMLYGIIYDDGSILYSTSPEELYKSHPGFKQWEFDRFEANLKRLAKVVEKDKKNLAFEEEAFKHEQNHFPQNDLGNRGYPLWGYHSANRLIKEDVKSGLAYRIKPSELRLMRDEYQKFPGVVFLGHVHQEKRSQREAGYWISKRNKDAAFKQEEEVENMKKEWQKKHNKK